MTAIFLPVIMLFIWIGGWIFAGGVALVLCLAGEEFRRMYRRDGRRPSRFLILGGLLVLVFARRSVGFEHTPLLLTLLLMGSMVWHLIDYERGAERSGIDFALTLTGVLYLGWLGAYLVSLRDLPDGRWWVLLVLPTVWLADGGAYLAGARIGRHRMTARLSPKKTWEGYLAGVLFGTAGAVGLAALYTQPAGPASAMSLFAGLVVGTVISTLAPLGDLGASMIKRELKLKDSSTLLPGHGGAFDRLDTWLWAAGLGFYVASVLSA